MPTDLHCNLYVKVAPPEFAMELISRALAGSSSESLIYGSMEIWADYNGYQVDGGDPNYFLQWETVLECEPFPGTSLQQAVSDVKAVMEVFRQKGYLVVADCMYEEELKVK
ncbi:hypothetical protein ACFRFJ_25905 [Streptomyces hydrogenans]|uniref:hypothetical protein n=1 Tax=Streptomyces hydrogenans TaxID=1873719 RepID=UPI0036BF63EB